MDEQPPLTPLTRKDQGQTAQPAPGTGPANLPFRQVAGRMLGAVLVWLVVNLVVFAGASFLVFMLLGSLGMAQGEDLFRVSILCATPLALIASAYAAGRRIAPLITRRYR